MAISSIEVTEVVSHSQAFRYRRLLNWFPLGLSYALLYMGRYNLTVAKTSLESLMTKEDFGIIFGAGTFVYGFSFLLNGPFVDRVGGRLGMLIAMAGSAVANMTMGIYLNSVLMMEDATQAPLRLVFSVLYSVNMYFQSFAAVAIVKVNSHWFHLRERGGFSGIFGTMISSGIFLAFTVNSWLLGVAASFWPNEPVQWVVFTGPASLIALFLILEFFLLRDRPSEAGFNDFDTHDASSGDNDNKPIAVIPLLKKILTNPIILTIAGVEFCTGVLRNGVMHWFPIYAKEVWALPGNHYVRNGSWDYQVLTMVLIVVGIVSWFLAVKSKGTRKGMLISFGALSFLAPFLQAGWGGILFIAGVIGGNVAGWVSDLFFQSRRAPSALGLYVLLSLCTIGMIGTLSQPTAFVEWADQKSGLQAGDKVISIAGSAEVFGWNDVATAIHCYRPVCIKSNWNAEDCICSTSMPESESAIEASNGFIPARIERAGQVLDLELPDSRARQKAGDQRNLAARPVLPLAPIFLCFLVFLMSLCVIGTHGLLSGTATMDFGGTKGAATAVGVIDGFVYAGTAVQSVALGYITTKDWAYWPWFLLPFALVGCYLLTRIWSATPIRKKA